MSLRNTDAMSRTMRAALLEHQALLEADPLVMVDLPIPEPRPGEVLIRVRACCICRTDVHIVEGDLPLRTVPVVPGHQAIGIVVALGSGVSNIHIGDRVGVAWLRHACGVCMYCSGGRENLCDEAEFNGWSANGGFAEYTTAPAEFVYSVPAGFDDVEAAPLLCAGIIGYRAMRLTGLDEAGSGWRGKRLGIYGFGAAGHVVIQLARGRGAEVFVCTRDRARHQLLAAELGAFWTGGSNEAPPCKLDASIIFAPAGELIPPALLALRKGGVLVLGGIHMSEIPAFPYELVYGERVVRSVTNNTRADGREFFAEAVRLPVRTQVKVFPFECINEALRELKNDAIKGAAVLQFRNREST